MRVIEFEMQNDFMGDYLFRMPVVSYDYYGDNTVIAEFLTSTVEETIEQLEFYGFGSKFIDLFTDLKYNNVPWGGTPAYWGMSFLHQIYPNMGNVAYTQDTTIASFTKAYHASLPLPITATVAPTSNSPTYTAYYATDNWGFRRSTYFNHGGEHNYGFFIEISACYDNQLNGNQFAFNENNRNCAKILISCIHTSPTTIYTMITIDGSNWAFGNSIINLIDGKKTRDTEQDSDDPYGDDDSTTGGGDGDHDNSSDPMDFPDLPTLSAVDTGFVTLYIPSATELKALATYMWTNPLFDLANWKKVFADPMDAILGLSIVPVSPSSGGYQAVSVGNISTGVSMNIASSQYVKVNCGSLTIKEKWGSYIDYSPFTKFELYLPYIGVHAIDTDDIMDNLGKSVEIEYHVDILSGACVAYVKCGDAVLYSFSGSCASSIPITGRDWTNVVNGLIHVASSIGSMVATGGSSAPSALTDIASTSVNVLKPNIEKSGATAGAAGLLGIQKPYLIITQPRIAKPANQNKYNGYPAYITRSLNELSGFTVVESIHLNNISASDDEIMEIMTLLRNGVIL